MKVFVKLTKHTEYVEFSVYEGLYFSTDDAVNEVVKQIPTTTQIKVLTKTEGEDTYVMIILRDMFTDNSLADLERKFNDDAKHATYYEWKGIICSFCLHEANVK